MVGLIGVLMKFINVYYSTMRLGTELHHRYLYEDIMSYLPNAIFAELSDYQGN